MNTSKINLFKEVINIFSNRKLPLLVSPNKLEKSNYEYTLAKADSGASDHYFMQEDNKYIHNLKVHNSNPITLPNKEVIKATQKGELVLHKSLSKEAQTAQILPMLKSSSLISIGKLCDDNCQVNFTKHKMSVNKDKETILTGYRNYSDGLWDIPIHKTKMQDNNYNKPNPHPAMYSTRQPHFTIKDTSTGKVSPPRVSIKRYKQKKKDIPHNNQKPYKSQSTSLEAILHEQTIKDFTQYEKIQTSPNNPSIAVIIRKKQTHIDLARYLHAACFSPVKSTLLKAIKNNHFTSWPGLTHSLVSKHLPTSTSTILGHQTKERQHLQSTTKPKATYKNRLEALKIKIKALKAKQKHNETLQQTFEQELHEDAFPISNSPNNKTNDVIYSLFNTTDQSTAFFDLTGRFPQRSSRGNQYIIIGYHYDANAIIAIPIKNRTSHTITEAWTTLHKKFSKAGVAPNNYVMDNEASAELKLAMEDNNTTYQLVPPHDHRNNLAERAIQTFKHHFKAGLASTDPNFPLSEWDRLLEQANITLNLLRSSRVNPKLSAYTYLFGEFNFNATPLPPPGTKVIAHTNASNRKTWDLNGQTGWYTGPALEHYRLVTIYFPKTRAIKHCKTVTFLPHAIPFPAINNTDFLKQAATDIITILLQPENTTTPSLQAGDPVRNALQILATQLNRIQQLPSDDKQQQTHTPSMEYKKHNNDKVSSKLSLDTHEKSVSNDMLKYTTSPTLEEDTTLPRVPNEKQQQTKHVNHRYPLRSLWKPPGTNFRQRAIDAFVAQNIFQPQVNHIYRPNGTKESIDTLLKGENAEIWAKALSNEWGRLAQGNSRYKGTDTIEFILPHTIPKDRVVTYATFVCDHRPLKTEPWRVRITVGGNRLQYPDDSGSPATDLTETKILLNSVISDADQGSRFMTADLASFFLASPMHRPEFMKIHINKFPKDIQTRYKLNEKVTSNGYIYIKIKKGMYGLKQAAILAYDFIKKNLAPFGYKPIPGTVGLWKHDTRRTIFCLCVDDFGIKYFSKDDANHLLNALGQSYKYTTDWEGKNYCGLTIDWNYQQKYVDISMPGYVTKALKRLHHIPTVHPQYSPAQHIPIVYGVKGTRQYANVPDTSPILNAKETTYIQSVVGTFLYYARAVDNTMLVALNELASEQSKPTVTTKLKAQRLMDYAATYLTTTVRYHASNMQLHVDTDAAYLIAPKAKSRIASYYHFPKRQISTTQQLPNGAVLVECKTLKHVVASAAEAEIAGVYHSAHISIPIRRILHALGHTQLATPIKTDNSTASGFIHDNIQQKRSKSWDMRYYWLRDKVTQDKFNIYWAPGKNNDGDYYTKKHPTTHHRTIRNRYVLNMLRTRQNRERIGLIPALSLKIHRRVK